MLNENGSLWDWCHPDYGHIAFWDTSGVTDMSHLFCNMPNFDEPIGLWASCLRLERLCGS